MTRQGFALLVIVGSAGNGFAAEDREHTIVTGKVQPPPRTDEASLPEIYRLGVDAFTFEQEPLLGGNGLIHSKVRFPSPMKTAHLENNTVHAELFRPRGPGPYACVIVLHIAGGDFPLSRFIASAIAQRGVAALFVKLPYYGERRPPGGKIRMLSNDLERGLNSMRQSVLDLRRACDWIAAQPELDGKRIGVMGVSLGAIVGGLASAIEPRISHACLVMGGAELEHILFGSSEREAREYRAAWRRAGGSLETFIKVIRPFDAASYGPRLSQRIVLMISASEDAVIPRQSTTALWEATGRQRNVWYPCGHYTMARYFLSALSQATEFFRTWPAERLPAAPAPPSTTTAGALGSTIDRTADFLRTSPTDPTSVAPPRKSREARQ